MRWRRRRSSAGAAPSDWPTPWELSAPESHVLEHRGGAVGGEPFRLAVKELVARRALRIERVELPRWLLRPKVTHALTDGPLIRSELATPLATALAVHRSAHKLTLQARRPGSTVAGPPIEGVTLANLAAAARREFTRAGPYHEIHVAPALARRGLLTRTGAEGYAWTPAGHQAQAELKEWLELGRKNLSRWAASDLARGVAYAQGAGAAALLLDLLYPERCRQRTPDPAELALRPEADAPTSSVRAPHGLRAWPGPSSLAGAGARHSSSAPRRACSPATDRGRAVGARGA